MYIVSYISIDPRWPGSKVTQEFTDYLVARAWAYHVHNMGRKDVRFYELLEDGAEIDRNYLSGAVPLNAS